jgi:hypothetical protein
MSSLPDSRTRGLTLAERQAQLAIALAAQAGAPPGFDEGRVSRASAALADKRAAAAAKLLPALWRSLGPEAGPAFRAYVTVHSFPGDHATDALAFAAAVCSRRSSPAVVQEVLFLRVRSGWPLRVGRAPRRLVVVARLAGRVRSMALFWPVGLDNIRIVR